MEQFSLEMLFDSWDYGNTSQFLRERLFHGAGPVLGTVALLLPAGDKLKSFQHLFYLLAFGFYSTEGNLNKIKSTNKRQNQNQKR